MEIKKTINKQQILLDIFSARPIKNIQITFRIWSFKIGLIKQTGKCILQILLDWLKYNKFQNYFLLNK